MVDTGQSHGVMQAGRTDEGEVFAMLELVCENKQLLELRDSDVVATWDHAAALPSPPGFMLLTCRPPSPLVIVLLTCHRSPPLEIMLLTCPLQSTDLVEPPMRTASFRPG